MREIGVKYCSDELALQGESMVPGNFRRRLPFAVPGKDEMGRDHDDRFIV